MNKTGIAARGKTIVAIINHAGAYASGFFFMAMVPITVYEVIVRYIFNSPTMWTLEISQYLMIYGALLGAAYTLEVDGHIKVELLTMRLSQHKQRILRIATSILGIAFCGILLWQTWQLTWDAYELNWFSSSPLKVYLFPVYLSMPIGSLLLLIQYIVKLFLDIGNSRSSFVEKE